MLSMEVYNRVCSPSFEQHECPPVVTDEITHLLSGLYSIGNKQPLLSLIEKIPAYQLKVSEKWMHTDSHKGKSLIPKEN